MSADFDREAILGVVRTFREHCYVIEMRDDHGLIGFALDQSIDTLAQWVDLETTVWMNWRLMFNEAERRYRRATMSAILAASRGQRVIS